MSPHLGGKAILPLLIYILTFIFLPFMNFFPFIWLHLSFNLMFSWNCMSSIDRNHLGRHNVSFSCSMHPIPFMNSHSLIIWCSLLHAFIVLRFQSYACKCIIIIKNLSFRACIGFYFSFLSWICYLFFVPFMITK